MDTVPLIIILFIGIILIVSILFRVKKRLYLEEVPKHLADKIRRIKKYKEQGINLANVTNVIESVGYITSILLLSFNNTDNTLYLASFIDVSLVFLEMFCSYYMSKCIYEIQHQLSIITKNK